MDATLHAVTPPLSEDRRIVRAAEVPALAKSERLFGVFVKLSCRCSAAIRYKEQCEAASSLMQRLRARR